MTGGRAGYNKLAVYINFTVIVRCKKNYSAINISNLTVGYGKSFSEKGMDVFNSFFLGKNVCLESIPNYLFAKTCYHNTFVRTPCKNIIYLTGQRIISDCLIFQYNHLVT